MFRLRLFCLAFFAVLISSRLFAAETKWRVAPLNPEFVRFLRTDSPKTRLQLQEDTRLARPVPSPLDLSHLASVDDGAALPARFDLRQSGRLSPVRDQDGYPACQAFATMGMLESMLLPGEALNLSEWHIYRYHGFDVHNESGKDSGGNWQMNAAYLLRWSGPVSEQDSPYGSGDDANALELPLQKHIQELRFFPPRQNSRDNNALKRYLVEHGPFYASILYDSSSYNSATASHYYSGGPDFNHGVIVVGWDDHYDRFRFLEIAPENGAFILRNSWGKQWGDGGYFYMSYYDTGFTPRMGVPQLEDLNNYARVYQYDPLGAVSIVGPSSSADMPAMAWGSNVFRAQEDGELSAVGFYLVGSNSAYLIRIYRHMEGVDPSSGQLFLEQAGERTHAGFVTVPLEIPVPIARAERFAVAVQFRTPGTRYPIPIEYPETGYSSAASASSGQSFISRDGVDWDDLIEVMPESNVCVKAYTAFSSPLRAALTAQLMHAEGWILRYPYVHLDLTVDSAGLDLRSVSLYRRFGNTETIRVAEIPVSRLSGGGLEWIDTSVSAGNRYAYQVRCFGPAGRFFGQSEWVELEVTP